MNRDAPIDRRGTACRAPR